MRFDANASITDRDWIVDTGWRRPDGKVMRIGLSPHLSEEQAIARAKQTMAMGGIRTRRFTIKRRSDRFWQPVSIVGAPSNLRYADL